VNPPDDQNAIYSQAIETICRILRNDADPSVRLVAAQDLGKLSTITQTCVDALCQSAETDPDSEIRKQALRSLGKIYKNRTTAQQLFQILQTMSETSKVQMNFNAPVTGVAGNVEGDFIVNASEQDLEMLLTDVTQILETLKQKHPSPTTEQTAIAIIDAEFQEIKQTQPWRWQNLLSLQRLWKGSKAAALKIGEHFAEENPWGKGIIGFLEGVSEEVE
jgi:hypothetical protein